MAETENQNTNVISEDKEKTNEPLIKSDVYYQYYVSDDKYPFEPIEAHFTFEGDTRYPFIKTAPDASIKSPKFDWTTHKWMENDPAAISEQIGSVTDKINTLNNTVVALQNDHQQAVKDNATDRQEIKSIQQMLASSNAMMGQLSGQMAQFSDAFNKIVAILPSKPAENVQKDSSEDADQPAESNAAQEQPQA